MPIAFEWQEWLWQKAQETPHGYNANLIKTTKGYGVAAATVYTGTVQWLELVREYLDLKCILRHTETRYVSDNGEWELGEVKCNQFSIYHNGERVTVEKEKGDKAESVPFVSYLKAAIKHTRDYLDIDLTLERSR